MERSLTTSRSLDLYYHINGGHIQKQYKDLLLAYRKWKNRNHAAECLVFPVNIAPRLCIYETFISNGFTSLCPIRMLVVGKGVWLLL